MSFRLLLNPMLEITLSYFERCSQMSFTSRPWTHSCVPVLNFIRMSMWRTSSLHSLTGILLWFTVQIQRRTAARSVVFFLMYLFKVLNSHFWTIIRTIRQSMIVHFLQHFRPGCFLLKIGLWKYLSCDWIFVLGQIKGKKQNLKNKTYILRLPQYCIH